MAIQQCGKAKMTSTNCQTRLSQLERYFAAFSENHAAAVEEPGFATYRYNTDAVFDHVRETFFEALCNFKDYLLCCIAPTTLDQTINLRMTTNNDNLTSSLNSSLPRIEIYKFNGTLTE